jgi:hypothetical protein
MKNYEIESTANLKFIELCEEIDMWKNEAMYYKEKYEESTKDYSKLLSSSIADAKNTTGQLLSLMFNSEQTDEGLLIKQK